jgi:hypothetical protein
MMRIKATDPDAPTMPTGPDYVLVRDKQGRLHHNVPAKFFPPEVDAPPDGPDPVLRLAHAIVRSTGIVRREWLPHLAPVFYDEFLPRRPRRRDDHSWIRRLGLDHGTHETGRRMNPLILRGDARKIPLPDESVSAIVTDPPY